MQNVNQSNYLGKEKLTKLLAKFAIPCILSLIISCLYNIVDQIFVGNMVGTAGNAATGIIFPIAIKGELPQKEKIQSNSPFAWI